MARIRTIKPEFWTNDQILDLSISARMAFIGMWNFSDDEGRHKASAKSLKAEVFPGDDLTVEDVDAMIDEMIGVGLVDEYTDAAGNVVWQVTGWAEYQRIDRPKPSAFGPRPDDGSSIHRRINLDPSSNERRSIVDPSSNDRRAIDVVREGKGRESKGEESKGKEGKGECAEPAAPTAAPAAPVFIRIPVVGGGKQTEAEVTEDKVVRWEEAYPGVDVRQQLRNMREWSISNPERRKTLGGVDRFITRWLATEQNKAGGSPSAGRRGAVDNSGAAASVVTRLRRKRGEAQ